MFAPFVEPDLEWDFRLKNVWSINCSGHKYGLVYPGIGWVVWRSKEALPEDLIFWVSYLGGEEATMAINFSRSASQIVGQYYVLMRNGFEASRRSRSARSTWRATWPPSSRRWASSRSTRTRRTFPSCAGA